VLTVPTAALERVTSGAAKYSTTPSSSMRTARPAGARTLGGLAWCRPRTGSGSARWISCPLRDVLPRSPPPGMARVARSEDRHSSNTDHGRGAAVPSGGRLAARRRGRSAGVHGCHPPESGAAGSGPSARALTAAAVPSGPAPNSPVEEEGARPRPLLSSGVHIAGCEPDPDPVVGPAHPGQA
jgi:hypothetical protein